MVSPDASWDPFASRPTWRPLLRESSLARNCLTSGLASLGKAHHMDKGLYSQAFFNISIGLERLMKLIYLVDHALRNGGSYPTQDEMRTRFRHDLVKLRMECAAIRERLGDEGERLRWELPDAEVSRRMVSVLAEFATQTRYYNLDYLVGAKSVGRDPLEAWATEVGAYFLSDYPDRLRRRDEQWAEDVECILGDSSAVLQEGMDGSTIRTLTDAVLTGRSGEWVQRRSTFHLATLVRELLDTLKVLNWRCGPGAVVELPDLCDGFQIFFNSDKYLKGRRTFAP